MGLSRPCVLACTELRHKCSERRARVGKPFTKGEDESRRNLGGRPKKKWLTEVAEELLEEKLSDPAFREIYKEQLWQKLMSGRLSAQ
jgi:hypothetical protein